MRGTKSRVVLSAMLVLATSAVLAGTATADLTGITITTGPTAISVSGLEPNPACVPAANFFYPGSPAGLVVDVYDAGALGDVFGQYTEGVPVGPGGAFTVSVPNSIGFMYGASLSVSPSWSYYVDIYNACTYSVSAFERLVTTPATIKQLPGRGGYCSVAGNKNPFTGTAYGPGTFLDLLLAQADTDPNFAGAKSANYYQGIGLSCDPPRAGYKDSGTSVDQTGHAASALYGGIYEYWTKP